MNLTKSCEKAEIFYFYGHFFIETFSARWSSIFFQNYSTTFFNLLPRTVSAITCIIYGAVAPTAQAIRNVTEIKDS